MMSAMSATPGAHRHRGAAAGGQRLLPILLLVLVSAPAASPGQAAPTHAAGARPAKLAVGCPPGQARDAVAAGSRSGWLASAPCTPAEGCTELRVYSRCGNSSGAALSREQVRWLATGVRHALPASRSPPAPRSAGICSAAAVWAHAQRGSKRAAGRRLPRSLARLPRLESTRPPTHHTHLRAPPLTQCSRARMHG